MVDGVIPRPWSSQHDAHGTSSSAPEYLAFHLLSRLAFNLCFFHSLLESTTDARDADGPNADADATRNATGNAARDADGSNANANADANATRNATGNADGSNADANANANAARDATRYAGIWSHRRASTYRTAEIW